MPRKPCPERVRPRAHRWLIGEPGAVMQAQCMQCDATRQYTTQITGTKSDWGLRTFGDASRVRSIANMAKQYDGETVPDA